jgi:hypothetical protein
MVPKALSLLLLLLLLLLRQHHHPLLQHTATLLSPSVILCSILSSFP